MRILLSTSGITAPATNKSLRIELLVVDCRSSLKRYFVQGRGYLYLCQLRRKVFLLAMMIRSPRILIGLQTTLLGWARGTTSPWKLGLIAL